MSYSVQNIRNVCLLGHSGSGKTSLAESLLFMTGAIDRMGRVADGNTVCDYDPEEVKRQISLSTAVAPIDYKGCRINVLDTPGAFDFSGEVMEALRAADAAIIVPTPADDVEAKACVKAAYEYNGPVYLRFGRLAVPVINDRPDYKFELGKGVVLREGKDVTIVATGLCVSSALEAAEKLAADGIDAKIINIHTIKPLDEELIVAAAKETGKVVTVEEHSVIGGLGSAVCDALAEKCPVPVKKIGVQDVFGESGPAVALLAKYKLDGEGVYEQVKEFCK